METVEDAKVEQLKRFGLPEQEVRYFLEVANGDMEVALGLMLDTGTLAEPSVPSTAYPTPPPLPTEFPSSYARPELSSNPIRGFQDIGGLNEDDNDENSEPYLPSGGNPTKQNRDELVSKVFESAKSHGATPKNEMPPEEIEKFTGVGYKLGNTVDHSTVVAPTPKIPDKKVVLTFWTDSFTVDDGPPRKYEDPVNAAFLNDIRNGVAPRELLIAASGAHLNIELLKKDGEYTPPPKPKIVAFSGAGHSLRDSSTTTPPTPTSTRGTKPVGVAQFLVVDETQPTTTLQVRLYDGSRLTIKCNLTHTIGNIKSHVEASHPCPKDFQLMMTFPNKVLSDLSSTVKDAGLANAAIVQKLL